MDFFPMFMNIKNREILICGGGKHAAEKIRRLRDFKPKFRVVSENISEEIWNMGNAAIEQRRFEKEDLFSNPVFVVAAEDTEENKRIAKICREARVPVNAVDQIEDCDFIFPSIFVTDNLCVGVSSGGVSPIGTVCLRDRFKDATPDAVDEIFLQVQNLKEKLKTRQVPNEKIRGILRIAMDKALDEERILTNDEISEILRKA